MHPKSRLRVSALPRIRGLPPRMPKRVRYAPNRLKKGTPEYGAFHSFSNQLRSATSRAEISTILASIGSASLLSGDVKNYLRYLGHQAESRVEELQRRQKRS